MSQERMTPFDAYQYHMSIKLHFKSNSYDFFKYGGRTNASTSAFEKRNDKYFFEKAAHIYDKEKYINKSLVEVIDNKQFFIKDIMSRENELKYLEWLGFMEGFEQRLAKELSNLKEYLMRKDLKFEDLFIHNDVYCPLMKMVFKKEVRYETIIAMQVGYKVLDQLNKVMGDDPIWNELVVNLNKYEPFILKYMPEKMVIRNLMLDSFKGL